MARLFAYKMTHDTGFAPNPFWNWLTIATCKPKIREFKHKGDWILGFSSKTMVRAKDPVYEERLIFVMQVSEKMTIQEYWNDLRFSSKIPNLSEKATVHKCGDNIYRPLAKNPIKDDDYEQIVNANHGPGNKSNDLSGRFVLIATRFWYFGQKRILLPDEVRPKVPYGRAPYGVLTHDQSKGHAFINYIESFSPGIYGPPHSWPETDNSWRNYENHIKP